MHLPRTIVVAVLDASGADQAALCWHRWLERAASLSGPWRVDLQAGWIEIPEPRSPLVRRWSAKPVALADLCDRQGLNAKRAAEAFRGVNALALLAPPAPPEPAPAPGPDQPFLVVGALLSWLLNRYESRFLPLVMPVSDAAPPSVSRAAAHFARQWARLHRDLFGDEFPAELTAAELLLPRVAEKALAPADLAQGTPLREREVRESDAVRGELAPLWSLCAQQRALEAFHAPRLRVGRATLALAALMILAIGSFATLVAADPSGPAFLPYLPPPTAAMALTWEDGRPKTREELGREFENFLRAIKRWTSLHPMHGEVARKDLERYGALLAWLDEALRDAGEAVAPATREEAEGFLLESARLLELGLDARRRRRDRQIAFLEDYLEVVLDKLAARPELAELRDRGFVPHWRALKAEERDLRLAEVGRAGPVLDQYLARLRVLEHYLADASRPGVLNFQATPEAEEARAARDFCRQVIHHGSAAWLQPTLTLHMLERDAAPGDDQELLLLEAQVVGRPSLVTIDAQAPVIELRRKALHGGKSRFVDDTRPYRFQVSQWRAGDGLELTLKSRDPRRGTYRERWRHVIGEASVDEGRFLAAPGYALSEFQRQPLEVAVSGWILRLEVAGLPPVPALFERLARSTTR